MKKVLLAVATLALVACGGQSSATMDAAQNDSLNNAVESLKAGIEAAAPAVKDAIENDGELKTLVEKAVKGEISEEEKVTLWQKIKGIGADVVMGNKNLEEAAAAAVSEMKNAGAEEVAGAAADAAAAIAGDDAASKVSEAAATLDDVAEKAQKAGETTKKVLETVDAVNDALKSLKK